MVGKLFDDIKSAQEELKSISDALLVAVNKTTIKYKELPKCYLQILSKKGSVEEAKKEIEIIGKIVSISNEIAEASKKSCYNTTLLNKLQEKRNNYNSKTEFFSFKYPQKSISFDFREC